MKKVLIIYPHGLGDCILATPALREYKKTTGDFVAVALMSRLWKSEIFKNNPYVDEELYICSDPWNDIDIKGEKIGFKGVVDFCNIYAKSNGYEEVIFVNHPKPEHKTIITARYLDVKLTDVHTEVYISNSDIQSAESFLSLNGFKEGSYGFIHTTTSLASWKNVPDGFGEDWLRKNKKLNSFIEIGKNLQYDSMNINSQFYIMKLASAVFLIDSVYFLACCAMDKPVDFVHFFLGVNEYRRVGPLHEVPVTVNFEKIWD